MDIRSYFGGKPSQSSGSSQKDAKPSPKKTTPAKGSKKRKAKVIESDDEDEDHPKNAKVQITPKKAVAASSSIQKPQERKAKLEDTDASSYFNSSNKIKRTAAPAPPPPKKLPTPKKKDDDDFIIDDDVIDLDFDEDLMQAIEESKAQASTSTNGTQKENSKPTLSNAAQKSPAKRTPTKRKVEEISSEDDFVEPVPEVKSKKTNVTPTRSAKLSVSTAKPAAPTPKRTPLKPEPKPSARAPPKSASKPPKKAKVEEPEEDSARKAILESVETIEVPDAAPTGDTKFNYRVMAARSGPAAPGSKEIPEGAEDCLTGLTFVFTGILESIERDDAVNLVKRYGGKVTGAPSSKTDYVVLGSEAGPKKLETIRKNNIKTINEDGLFQLIRSLPARGGSGKTGQQAASKKAEEEKKIKETAKEMEAREKAAEAAGGTPAQFQLWTEKHKPTALKDIIGNKGLVEKLQRWLHNWPKNVKANFKKPGPDGLGIYRAVCLSGPPGIGKTTSAHLVAKLEGYDILEYNASDTRNEKLLREKLAGVTDNTSIAGFMQSDIDHKPKVSQRLVLIMDEIDGMSAGDRGGVGALKKVISKTKIPIICICNDRRHPKLRPLDRAVFDMTFRRPQANEARSRLMTIAYREGLSITPNVVDQLVEGTHSDIRQILNLLSTYRLSQSKLEFDNSKKFVKDAEKYVVLKPWDIASKFLSSSGGLWHANSKSTLNDKIELYFNDHEFSYLMIQENYLKSFPDMARNAGDQREQKLKALELAERASESISNGDLVDALIHGPQQHWSLMPTHAVFSSVMPSYYMHGSSSGQYSFTSWLGNNSKQGKLIRMLREIQGHMRLRISGDRNEVRQSYMQTLFDRLVRRFAKDGGDAVGEMIELMDEYYLTKEDFDSIVEISIGHNDGEALMKDVPSNAKAAFTRKHAFFLRYNAASHPMAFQKASSVVVTKGAKRDRPDVEDALDESDEGEIIEESLEDDEEEEDLSKDKMIKAKKPKAAKPVSNSTKGNKGKGK